MIRNEVHTRCRFASKKYYEIVRRFARTNLRIQDGKIQDGFKMLSGVETHLIHKDLLRCYNIYEYYRNEYSNSLNTSQQA